MRDSVWASVRASVGVSVYGQHDAEWLAFYSFFREVCGLASETDKLNGLFELAQSANWAIPYKDICWISERHHVLQRDQDGRLHCLAGPALMYPDGWAIYAIHGVRVVQAIVEHPDTITAQAVMSEPNAEVRRVMIEQMGYERFLCGADAREIQRDADPHWGTLYEVPNVPVRWVKMRNCSPEPDGSWREYIVAVPREIRTAREGILWSWDMKTSEFDKLEERYGFVRS
jgi:hypothetical protein